MSTFSKDDETQLINVIASHSLLYDSSDPNYRNPMVKNKVWQAIGKDLNKSGYACKKKWKAIRDGYHRFKKKYQLGSVAPKNSKDKRHLLLAFLDSVPQHTSGGSSIPLSPTMVLQTEWESVDDPLSSNEQEESKDGLTSNTEQDSENEVLIKSEITEQMTNLVDISQGIKEEPLLNVWKDRDETEEEPILNVWKDRDEKRQTVILEKEDDDIDLFVRHIGVVLRNLPQVEKAQAKKNLYSVLSDYEIMAAKRTQNSLPLSNYK